MVGGKHKTARHRHQFGAIDGGWLLSPRVRAAVRLPLLLAGLAASLFGSACSGDAVIDPAPVTVSQSPEQKPDVAGSEVAPESAPTESAIPPEPKAAEPLPAAVASAPATDQLNLPVPSGRPIAQERQATPVNPYAGVWKTALSGIHTYGNGPRPTSPNTAPEMAAAMIGSHRHPEAFSERRMGGTSPNLASLGDPTPRTDGEPAAPSEPADGNAPDTAAPTEPSGDAPLSNTAEPFPEGDSARIDDFAHLAPYLQGIASWYGPNFHGKLTANGETYNQYGLTAAHPVLPIGTRVLVENTSNGRKVWLRINDRGPYAKGRILDLSRIAAERLGMIENGTAPVKITVLRWPETMQASLGLKAFQQFTVQAAAYPDLDTAEDLRERLQAEFPDLAFFVDHASNGFFAVAAGPFDDEREAKQVSNRIHRTGVASIVKRYRN
jgi:rare lipoprotein A